MGDLELIERFLCETSPEDYSVVTAQRHGKMRRGLTAIKMRGSWHDKQTREYVIDKSGMHIKEAFHGVNGILTGSPTANYQIERERLDEMFDPPAR